MTTPLDLWVVASWIWLAGVAACFAWIVRGQAKYMAEVRRGRAGPAVVGFLWPKVVVPGDFALRFDASEREVMLAHESMHLTRGDARIAGLVAFIRSLNWFNPLVHVAINQLRIDQELACDAQVLRADPGIAKLYAETMIKAQLATQPLPIGCSWPASSQHPLTERVALIVEARPSHARVLCGAALVALAGAGCGGLAWAAQPPSVVSAPAPIDQPGLSAESSLSVESTLAGPQPDAPEQEAPAPSPPPQPKNRITGSTSPILTEAAWMISGFGPRIDPFNGERVVFHDGVDLKATFGAPIHAPADGVVVFAGTKGGYGRVVELKFSDREVLRFGHLNSIAVQAGARVKAGDKIGSMGSTGRSSGLHVHVEYLYDGENIDPLLVGNLKLATSLNATPVPETPGWPTRTEAAAAAESPPAPEAQPAPDAPP